MGTTLLVMGGLVAYWLYLIVHSWLVGTLARDTGWDEAAQAQAQDNPRDNPRDNPPQAGPRYPRPHAGRPKD